MYRRSWPPDSRLSSQTTSVESIRRIPTRRHPDGVVDLLRRRRLLGPAHDFPRVAAHDPGHPRRYRWSNSTIAKVYGPARKTYLYAGDSSFIIDRICVRNSGPSTCPWVDTACSDAACSTSISVPLIVSVQPVSLGKSRQSATIRPIAESPPMASPSALWSRDCGTTVTSGSSLCLSVRSR